MARPNDDGPIGEAEFESLMAALGRWPGWPSCIAAVSGGRDSMALALLADRWCRAKGGVVLAVTVDHGLRDGSAAEARQVKTWLSARGIANRTIRWTGPKPASNISALARQARYALLAKAARRGKVGAILVAHHLEDQAETFLLRLGRGSGVDGLSGMAARSEHDGLALLRPLLAVPRIRLEATLRAAGQDWVEDPSNTDPRFARIGVRRLLPQLAEAGISVHRIATAAQNLRRAREALERGAADLLALARRPDGTGRQILLDAGVLLAAPREIGLRALDIVLREAGDRRLPPRLDRLERLYAALAAGPGPARTFSGCVIRRKAEQIIVTREAGRRRP